MWFVCRGIWQREGCRPVEFLCRLLNFRRISYSGEGVAGIPISYMNTVYACPPPQRTRKKISIGRAGSLRKGFIIRSKEALYMWNSGWDKIFEANEWGKYPPEELVRFVA